MKPDYLASPTLWSLALGSFVFALFLTPFIIRLARRAGAIDRGGHRCLNNQPMPLLGGLVVAIPFVIVCLLGMLHAGNIFDTIEHHHFGLLVLAVGSIGIVALGFYDDVHGLNARDKFLGQILLATLACFAGYTIEAVDIPLYGTITFGPLSGTLLTILWIVGLTNAYNLIDGIDGLAAGLALIAALGLFAIAVMNGSTFPALMCVALCGALLGFLCFNFHPARIFLGDTGSMFLGFVLANITLMGSLKTTGAVIFMAPVLIMGIPILDTLISIIRRYLRGRPLFTGDNGHIHHRLLKRGYSQRSAALTFYAIGVLMTASAVASWALPVGSGFALAAYGCYAAAVLLVIWIAGLRPGLLFQMKQCRQRNLMLNALSRYVSVRLSNLLNSPSPDVDEILGLICQELRLRFLTVEDEKGERLMSFDNSPNAASSQARGPICLMKVRVAANGIVFLSFQCEQPIDEMVKTDIEACLASIFEHARAGIFSAARKMSPPAHDLQEVPVFTSIASR